MGPAPLAGLRPGQAHHPSRGWRHHHHPSQPVAGELCHRRVSLRLSAISHRAAWCFIELSGFRCAPHSSSRLHHAGAAALFLRKQQQRSAQHADGRAAIPERFGRAHTRQSGSIILGHQLRSAFPQRLYRHGHPGHRSGNRKRKVERLLRRHSGSPSCQRPLPERLWGRGPGLCTLYAIQFGGPCHRRLRP